MGVDKSYRNVYTIHMTNFNDIANMKLSDFENIGQAKYNEGFKNALTTVVKLLNSRICEDYNADGACEHELCKQNDELSNGIEGVIRSVS